jgi:hypothetical protein
MKKIHVKIVIQNPDGTWRFNDDTRRYSNNDLRIIQALMPDWTWIVVQLPDSPDFMDPLEDHNRKHDNTVPR